VSYPLRSKVVVFMDGLPAGTIIGRTIEQNPRYDVELEDGRVLLGLTELNMIAVEQII